jgi:hypothetical protein
MGLLREALVRIRCVIVDKGTYAEVLFLISEMSQSSHDASEKGVMPETREMLDLAKKS